MDPNTLNIDWRKLLDEHHISLRQLAFKVGMPYHKLWYMVKHNPQYIDRETVGIMLNALGVILEQPFTYGASQENQDGSSSKRRFRRGRDNP